MDRLTERYPTDIFYVDQLFAYRENPGQTLLREVFGTSRGISGVLKSNDVAASQAERKIYHKLASTGLVPRLLDSWTCDAFLLSDDTLTPQAWEFLHLEAVDGTLEDLLVPGLNPDLFEAYLQQIKTKSLELNKIHLIRHGDFHPGNILYQRQPNGHINFLFIDFDAAIQYNEAFQPVEYSSQVHPQRSIAYNPYTDLYQLQANLAILGINYNFF